MARALNGVDVEVDRLENENNVRRDIYYFFTIGCEWAQANNGGPCLACGHFRVSSFGKMINNLNDRIIEQFNAAFLHIDRDVKIVSLYNAGSFLNNQEVPLRARKYIFEEIARKKHIKRIIIESLPCYLEKEKIGEIKTILKGKEIEIGIGVDSLNGFVRKICINKGQKLTHQLEALEKIKSYDLLPLAYVLLKPVFLSEIEAIQEAVDTIKFLVGKGVNRISLEPISIQPGSFAHYLYRKRLYSCPSVWSVQEVVNQVKNLDVHLKIGGWQYRPQPIRGIKEHRCPNGCHEKFSEAFRELNGTGNYNKLLELSCACKKDWIKRCEREKNLLQNMKEFISLFDTIEENGPEISIEE